MAETLFDSLLDSLKRVLSGSGVPAGETDRLVRAVGTAEDSEAMTDFLLARAPKPTALMAVDTGFLYHVDSGLLLLPKQSPTLDYAVAKRPFMEGRAVRCRVGEQEGWLYQGLDGLAVHADSGARVNCGDVLTDGTPDLPDVLAILGLRRATDAAAERLMSLCALGPEDAKRVADALFDAVEIFDHKFCDEAEPSPLLYALCTPQRFRAENERPYPGNGLTGRLRWQAVDVLAAMHDNGGCLPHPWLSARRAGEGGCAVRMETGSFLGRPSTKAISSVEREYRMTLPEDYLHFLETYNGAIPEDLCVDVDGNQRLIVRFLAILDHPVAARHGEAGWYDISVTMAQIGARLCEEEDKDQIGLKLIPFAALFGGDYLCLDFRADATAPSVAYWDHSSPDFQPRTIRVARSFSDFCAGL